MLRQESIKEFAYTSYRLIDAVLVFHQGKSHMSLAGVAESDAGRNGHLCLFE